MSASTAFQQVNEHGWRRGFANLLGHENSVWWRTRRWWTSLLIWLVIVNGGVLVSLSTSDTESANAMTPEEVIAEAMTVFVVLAGVFGTIGAIVAMQGTIIDEKKSGTAAWILSKPASRTAFLLSKLLANAVALLIIVIVVQGAIAYAQLASWSGNGLSAASFASAMALLGLHMLFYLSLTLMLGTLFNERGPVIAIPMGILFGGQFALGFVGSLAHVLPWMIPPSAGNQGLAIQVMSGQPLATTTPILATIIWILIFVGVTLWRFGREEF